MAAGLSNTSQCGLNHSWELHFDEPLALSETSENAHTPPVCCLLSTQSDSAHILLVFLRD